MQVISRRIFIALVAISLLIPVVIPKAEFVSNSVDTRLVGPNMGSGNGAGGG